MKTLYFTTSPLFNTPNAFELELRYGSREIGALTLDGGDLGEFIEALRAGFTVVADQKRRDVASFADDVCDSEDD